MRLKEVLQLIKKAPLPRGKELLQSSFYKDAASVWQSSGLDLSRVIFNKIEEMPPADILTISESGLWGGHTYLFAYRIMPPRKSLKLVDRATARLGVVLGKETEVTTGEEGIEGKFMRFGTRDSVYVPDDGQVGFAGTFDGKEFQGEGRIACTTSDHALSGLLCHVCMRCGSAYYMVCYGSGRYPIPLLSGIVDYMNCTLGGRLWQMTDWVYEYDEYGHTDFREYYGQEAVDKVMSLREAQSMDWAVRKNESFLGEGDGVFLGDVSGSYGQMLETAVGFGYFSRVLQQRFAQRIKDQVGRHTGL